MSMSRVALTFLLLVSSSVLAQPADGEPVSDTGDSPKAQVEVLLLDTLAGAGVGADAAAGGYSLLVRSLSSLDHVVVIEPKTLVQRMSGEVPEEVRADLARAANYARKGRECLLNLSLEDATDAFQTARVILRRHLRWLDDPDPLIVVLMGLAESLATAGQRQEARAAYQEVLVLSPGYEPDPGQVPGKFRSLFNEVREKAAQDLAGSLSVTCKPSGANVLLDGLTIGSTPVVKGGVPAGLHALNVQKEGFRTLRTSVEVTSGESTVVSEKLPPLLVPELIRRTRQALAGGGNESRPEVLARDLARIAGVPAVVLSQVAQGAEEKKVLVVAVLLAAVDQPYLYAARLEAGRGEEVGKTLAWQISDALDGSGPVPGPPADLGLVFEKKLLGEPGPRKPLAAAIGKVPDEPVVVPIPPPIPPPRPDDVSDTGYVPIWGKWWFWAGAGAVVAAAVGTTLALTLGGKTTTIHEPDRIHVLVDRVIP
jgi:hypothetical protein